MSAAKLRFQTLTIREGITTQNRIVVPPMASETANENGEVTEKTIAHYSRLTESGAGLVFVEYSHVHPSGRSEAHQLAADSEKTIPGLRRLAEVLKEMGALAGLQLTHSGGKSSELFTGNQLMGPSAVSVPQIPANPEVPREMSEADIELWKRSFLEAAGRAVQAGFDAVEIHAAHGYGLNQWLSPLTNRRTDRWGRTLFNRARLLFEIVASIRRLFPRLIISVRIPGQDLLPGGFSVEDSTKIAQELERRGVDLIHVSSGIGGWRRPRDRRGEGYLVGEARVIQAAVGIPVIGVGGIESANYIESLLAKGDVALVAVGRAILADPLQWKRAVLSHI